MLSRELIEHYRRAVAAEPRRRDAKGTKDRLLRAAEYLFIRKGYSATTVDEICKRSGTTKGAFFHHFKNKEDLGLACGQFHAVRRMAFLEQAMSWRPDEPLGRLFDYLDHVTHAATHDELPACLIGVLTMELAAVNAKFQTLCNQQLEDWTSTVEKLLADAIASTGRDADSRALARHFITTFQGSLVLAKARGNVDVIKDSMGEYRSHVAHVVTGGVGPTPRRSHNGDEHRLQ